MYYTTSGLERRSRSSKKKCINTGFTAQGIPSITLGECEGKTVFCVCGIKTDHLLHTVPTISEIL